MQIFIRYYSEVITLNVEPTDIIAVIKDMIFTKLPHVDQQQVRLMFSGKDLSSDCGKTLAEFNVQKESTLFLVIPLKGN